MKKQNTNWFMLLGFLGLLGFIGFFPMKEGISYIWFMFFAFFAFFSWGILLKQKQDERFIRNSMKAKKVSLGLAFIVLILLTKEIAMEKTSNEVMVLFSSLSFAVIINIEPFLFLFYEKLRDK